MKVIDERNVYQRVSRDFQIELENGKTIWVNKWFVESDGGTDGNSELDEENQKIYDSLTEDEQDDLQGLINDLLL